MQEAKKLNVEMKENEFDEFSKALGADNFKKYAEEYINKHRDKNLTSDDVLSLALIYALKNDHDSVQKILSVPYNENIFTTADEYGYNAIYFLLTECSAPEEEEMLNSVFDHLQHQTVTKVDLKGETFVHLCGAMQRSLFEGMIVQDQLEHCLPFLQPIYTEESLDRLQYAILSGKFDIRQYKALGHEKYFGELDKNTDSFLDPEDVLPEVPHRESVTDETKKKHDMIDANGDSFADKLCSEKLNNYQEVRYI